MTLYLTIVYLVVLFIYLIINKFEIKEIIPILLIMLLYIIVYDKSMIKQASDIGYSRFLTIYITVPIILYIYAMFPSLFLMFTSIFDGIDIFYAKKVTRFIMSVCLFLITIIVAILR